MWGAFCFSLEGDLLAGVCERSGARYVWEVME